MLESINWIQQAIAKFDPANCLFKIFSFFFSPEIRREKRWAYVVDYKILEVDDIWGQQDIFPLPDSSMTTLYHLTTRAMEFLLLHPERKISLSRHPNKPSSCLSGRNLTKPQIRVGRGPRMKLVPWSIQSANPAPLWTSLRDPRAIISSLPTPHCSR